jgi:hypothetical protein
MCWLTSLRPDRRSRLMTSPTYAISSKRIEADWNSSKCVRVTEQVVQVPYFSRALDSLIVRLISVPSFTGEDTSNRL